MLIIACGIAQVKAKAISVYKVPGFLSSRRNWGVSRPPQASVAPPFVSKGGDTLACGEGVGGPNSDDGTDTLVLYANYKPSTSIRNPHAVYS
jgi:hypothetical protein